jgi:hypothetical protein
LKSVQSDENPAKVEDFCGQDWFQHIDLRASRQMNAVDGIIHFMACIA